MRSLFCSKQSVFVLLIGLLLLGAATARPLQAERIYLDITAQDVRKVVVAVPWFASADEPRGEKVQGGPMAELLGRALEFHGFIQVLDVQQFGGRNDAD